MIQDHGSLGSLYIKGTDESMTRVDLLVPLIYHDPSDLGTLILIWITPKEQTPRFCLLLYMLLRSHDYKGISGPGGVGGGGTPYNGLLYGEAPPKRSTFFRLQVYKRVGISQAEVYKRVGKSVI